MHTYTTREFSVSMARAADNKTWLQRNKDWLITVALLLVFLMILGLSSLIFKNGKKADEPVIEEEATFELQSTNNQNEQPDNASEPLTTTSFFLRPNADELLEKLEGMNYQDFKQETKNLPGLRVMWPAYFFSITKVGNKKADVMLDASEDGFGVIFVTEIDLEKYPEILTLEKGRKIWLAAEITGVDITGTGQFFLKTEFIRFDDYKPPAKAASPDSPADQ